MSDSHAGPSRHSIGRAHGVTFEVVAWDGVHAEAALSVSCMFEREAKGAAMAGGLLHLDRALAGGLSALRSAGDFRAEEMETLLIRTPPPAIKADAILVIGLGDPETISSEVLERAVRVALREAVRFNASSVAFAPSLLDAGVVSGVTGDGAVAMLRGALDALAAEQRLAVLGLAPPPALARWSFDAGPTHLDSVGAEFSAAFEQITRFAAGSG